MPVHLKCVFTAKDEKIARFQQSEMFDRVESVIADSSIQVTPDTLVHSVSEPGSWELRGTIAADDRQVDWVSKRGRVAVGSPWNTRPDGQPGCFRQGT